eukprot:TRINITY_DN3834_c0_g1_i1.p2 TRINITY_DN3834_c0_g1~~TRINITY_DN3834_c0_g1_i1.p2  ORF type:complete len:206 (-),score=12.79 TRINITY_DN3834_c0_g1_i1:122-739(-)
MEQVGLCCCFFFFFKQKTAYEIMPSLVGSEMCIRDRYQRRVHGIAPRIVKNFVWVGIGKYKPEEFKTWFKLLKECGISGVMFEGYNEEVYKYCHEAGLEAHYWKWTMNRAEVKDIHPDWFGVNRKGESCYDKPAYVDYYRFLCPNHEGVAEYLANDYVKIANLPYVDGVHLDYVRFPDVVLPVSLWKNYGIEQTQEPMYLSLIHI